MCTAGYFASKARAHVGSEIREFFHTVEEMAGISKTRIRPTDSSPFVRLEDDGQRHLRFLHWGLTPSWSKTPKFPFPTYNARCETVTEKATFRDAFKKRRGLMVWTSYVEWRDENGVKIPYEFMLENGDPIGFAGLWDQWGTGTEYFESCTMITCDPNSLAAPFHDRMPVILEPDNFEEWLSAKTPTDDLLSLLRPLPSDRLVAVLANADDFKRPVKSKQSKPGAPPLVQSLFDFENE